jgi:peptidoglycan-associated lipoprotein
MTRRTLLWSVGIVSLVAAATLTGCARRTPQSQPSSPLPEAAPTPAPTPAPATPQQPETPSTTLISSGDFRPAFFDYDSYSLREDARAALDHNARLLRDNAGAQITIEGHCDERGTAEYNQALGERRAEAAKEYLVAAGIESGRIQTVSYGKERPFATGQDEASWQQNRRAHFVVR